MNNISYLLALHSIDGLGPIRLRAILDYFKDPKLAWQGNAFEFSKIGIPKNVVNLFLETRKKMEPENYAQTIKDSGIKWITIFDKDYPKLLSQIYDPPIVLYYRGQLFSDQNNIAVVGTRKMTGYGKAATDKFVTELVANNLAIVSGLARGIDSQAHKTALRESGRTLAVLGGGLNKIYPSENINLAEEIVKSNGVIMSEFPPDYGSLPGNFPARNRIISGLSMATIVVEAAQDSGSLITARLALEQGREVFAVPGPITSSLSKGPIGLIREGARAVFDPQEILDELGVNQGGRVKDKGQSQIKLSEDEKKILKCLENEVRHIDEIGRMLSFPSSKISAMLLKMEIVGLVQNLGSGNYTKG